MADLGTIGDAYSEPLVSSTISNLPSFSFTGVAYSEPLVSSTISNLPSFSFTGNLYATDSIFSNLTGTLTPLGTEAYSITGTVKNSSLAFVARTVIAADRDTGIIYDKVISDSTTGAFTLKVPNVTCVVYCLPDPADGVNAEIFDLIVPT